MELQLNRLTGDLEETRQAKLYLEDMIHTNNNKIDMRIQGIFRFWKVFVVICIVAFLLFIFQFYFASKEISIKKAICTGDVKLVQSWLRGGGSLSKVEFVKETPLTYIFEPWCRNQFAMAKLLISVGANVNRPDHYKIWPLIYAAYNCDITMLQLFINNGAKLTVVDPDGLNLITGCSADLTEKSAFKYLNFILSHGYKPDRSTLFWRSSKRHQSVKEKLISLVEK